MKPNKIFFVGIGGIGMSAIARFYNVMGYRVAGYDRTESPLTVELEQEGISVSYSDCIEEQPEDFFNDTSVLVVYTPAIPKDNKILNFYNDNGYRVMKRSQILGQISKDYKGLCIAGTHGKTTVSTMLAYLLKESSIGCNAFLGGISTNYQTNVLIDRSSPYVVIEADEFDRSFLTLSPYIAGVTSMEADHLDIYEDLSDVESSFQSFVDKVVDDGAVFLNERVELNSINRKFTYGLDSASNFSATNFRLEDGLYRFDILKNREIIISDVKLGVPGKVNVENAILAISIALQVGVTPEEICKSLPEFKGVFRRFNIRVNNDRCIFIDDYAHHPSEIKATLSAIKELWPQRQLTVVFQPHLYTRTRDFASEFATSLDLADQIVLLDIYPARELPIEGVTSEIISNQMKKPVRIVSKEKLLSEFDWRNREGIIVTLGAGDIDRLVEPLQLILS